MISLERPLQKTHISNLQGVNVIVHNDTNDEIFIQFPNKTEFFEPREIKYFVRDIDDEIPFNISQPSIRTYNISRYVNNVVIKKSGDFYQPAFFFSTRKFVE
jgi:hypothetical protein